MIASQQKMERWHKKHKGFGMEKTSAEWAALSGLHRNTMRRYLFEYGVTVEEIYKLRGIAPPGAGKPEPAGNPSRNRKPRRGAKLEETRQTIYTLLVVSGYVGPGEGIEAVWAGYQHPQSHKVAFKDCPVGSYNYEKKELKLTSGEGLKLEDRFIGELKIRKNHMNLWEVHPETRQLLANEFIQDREKRGE